MSDGTVIAASLVLVAVVVAFAWVRARRDAQRHELALLEAQRPGGPQTELVNALEELRAQVDVIDTRVNRLELRTSFGPRGKR